MQRLNQGDVQWKCFRYTGSQFIKSGAGRLILSGNNQNIGSTSVNSGTLSISGNQDFVGNVGIASGAVLEFDTAAAEASRTYTGVLSGAGDLKKVSANELQLNGDSASTFTGTTTVSGGSVYVPGALTESGDIVLEDGFFELTSTSLGSSYTGTISFSGGLFKHGQAKDFSPQYSTAANQQYKIQVLGPSDGSRAYSAALTSQGGSLELVSGNLVLDGANTYGGDTTISGGSLTVNGSLADSTVVDVQAGTYRLGNDTIASLSGSGRC